MDPIIQAGSLAPNFTLPDLEGSMHELDELKGRVVVLNFWSPECEWSERVDRELIAFMVAWEDEVTCIWIASNANEPREMIERVSEGRGIPLVLLDPEQQVADQYGAQTTPHIFILDRDGRLAYQGAWDDINWRQRVATQVYVPQVVQALLQDQSPPYTESQPYGCVLVRYSDLVG
jgi:peroxiredoxin